METPSHTKSIAKKSRWELRPSDLPSTRVMKQFPELQDLENNCVFRLLTMRTRSDSMHRTMAILFFAMLTGMLALNTSVSIEIRITGGVFCGILLLFSDVIRSSKTWVGWKQATYEVLSHLAVTPITSREILMGLIGNSLSQTKQVRWFFWAAVFWVGATLMRSVGGGWVLGMDWILTMVMVVAVAQIMEYWIAPTPNYRDLREGLLREARRSCCVINSSNCLDEYLEFDRVVGQTHHPWLEAWPIIGYILAVGVFPQIVRNLTFGSTAYLLTPWILGVTYGCCRSAFKVPLKEELPRLEQAMGLIVLSRAVSEK